MGRVAGNETRTGFLVWPAAQLGIDIDVVPGWFINLDARWFDIDTNAKLAGADVGTIEIDPYAFGVTVGHSF